MQKATWMRRYGGEDEVAADAGDNDDDDDGASRGRTRLGA